MCELNRSNGFTTEVYCDNQNLQRTIILHQPVTDGLFSHEIAMLAYTTFGQFTTKELRFSSTWKYTWYVEYPAYLFFSLKSRGYIRECLDSEFLDLCRMEDLRVLLNKKSVKCGSVKETALKKARELYADADIAAVLGFRYYVLSESGRNVINSFPEGPVMDNVVSPLARQWRHPLDEGTSPMSPAIKKLRRNNVKIVDVSTFELEIDSSFAGVLYLSSVKPRIRVPMHSIHHIHCFPQQVNVDVSCNGLRIHLDGITHLMLLSHLRKLLYGTISKDRVVDFTCVDLMTGLKVFDEQVQAIHLVNPSGPSYEYNPHQLFPDSTDGIIDEEFVHYYVSPADEISNLIINSYFKDAYSVRKLPPLLDGDISSNYCVSVPADDAEGQRFLSYLITERRLREPHTMGVRIFDILFDVVRKSQIRVVQLIMDNASGHDELLSQATGSVMDAFDGKFSLLCKRLREIYPNRALQSRPFQGYTTERNYGWDDNFSYAYEHQDKYSKRYDALLLSLKEKGIIPSVWISEFSLYLLIKAYYEDAIYQYRADWLGQQSLDVFVPSLRIGFEYQGEQHSRPIDRFGGEEKFRKTIERDSRKRNLCQKNNVALVYWNFDEAIEDQLLARKLSAIGASLPMTKSFPAADEHAVIKTQSIPEKADGKALVYQYDKQFNLLGSFNTTKEAATIVGVSSTSIAKALRGERLLSGGFFWHKGDCPLCTIPMKWREFAEKDFSMTASKKVRQISEDGLVIAEYDSIGEAARAMGSGTNGIRDVISGKQKHFRGYKWETFAADGKKRER